MRHEIYINTFGVYLLADRAGHFFVSLNAQHLSIWVFCFCFHHFVRHFYLLKFLQICWICWKIVENHGASSLCTFSASNYLLCDFFWNALTSSHYRELFQHSINVLCHSYFLRMALIQFTTLWFLMSFPMFRKQNVVNHLTMSNSNNKLTHFRCIHCFGDASIT